MENQEQAVIDFSYELYKESVEPLIRYKGLRNLHLIIGHSPFIRDSKGDFMPLMLEMEDDAGHTHNVHFNPITGRWLHDFMNLMFMEYFGMSPEESEEAIKMYMSGERTQQIFQLESGTLIYLRMDASFSGSGMVLTAVPRYEAKYTLPSQILAIKEQLPGLVLFTGSYGSNRAYTMYTLLLNFIQNLPRKISFVEQVPRYNLDFVKESLVMRRIAFDPQTTYYTELIRALTTDVDIICLDDISEPKAFDTALRACAAGKTVFAQLGASSIQEALDAILLRYEPKKREMIRYQLSIALRAVIFQQKLPTAEGIDFPNIPAYELIAGHPLSHFIGTYKPGESSVNEFIAQNPKDCIAMQQSLEQLHASGTIDERTFSLFSTKE